MSTPIDKDKFKNLSQIRTLTPFVPLVKAQRIESSHYVEGYATRYDPYILFEDEDGPIYECFDRGCFDTADMSDVIMQFDHAGRVYARTGNNSLLVWVDDNGLGMAADLSRTEGAKRLYEDIKTAMITKMSWRFSLGDYDYNPDTRTITHRSIKKIWDVSAVSIPANQNTEINARSFCNGVITEATRREVELEERRRKLRLSILIATTHIGGNYDQN